MPRSVRDKDLGLKKILKEVNKLKRNPHVKIGLLSDTGSKKKEFSDITAKSTGNTSVLEVGIYNEFGTVTIPPRPFIRKTYDDSNKKWFSMIRKSMNDIYLGKTTVKRSLDIVGLQATADIKKKIKSTDPSWPPNAPATIRKKKSSKPLIDTGQLIGSIAHSVNMAGKE